MSFIINPYRFGVAYDALITAWLARGTTLGYTLPSAAETAKLNTAVVNLRNNGVITGFDVLYFMMFGDSDMATLNVMAPSSYQITKVNSPTWTSGQGFQGNGSSSYLDTNFAVSTDGVNYTLTQASRGIWVYTANVSGSVNLDGVSSGNNNSMQNQSTNAQRINLSGASTLSGNIDFSGTGYFGLNRSSSTNIEGYAGTTQTSRTASGANNTLPGGNQLILHRTTQYTDAEVSIYYLGRSFSQTEHGYINTEFTTLMS